jgi:D-alanyl-D-alanine carboxypeptidase
MNRGAPGRARAVRVPRLVLVGLAVAAAAIIGTLGHQPVPSSATSLGGRSPNASQSAGEIPLSAPGDASPVLPSGRESGPPRDLERGAEDALRGDRHGALGTQDGLVPDGASVFDDETAAVANLDPSLLKALRRSAKDAAGDGVEFQLHSGWRSPDYQEQLLREAVSEYGSAEEAARWVATPNTSAHVSGDAVDIGPLAATTWLSEHGAQYGLCQIYRNESWHFELRPEATSRGCPRMYADPTQDPRLQP